MAEAFEKGRKLLSNQSYELKTYVADGDRLWVEVLWTGTLEVALGSLAARSQMRAHSAMFFEFKDGRIVQQQQWNRNLAKTPMWDGPNDAENMHSLFFAPSCCDLSLKTLVRSGHAKSWRETVFREPLGR